MTTLVKRAWQEQARSLGVVIHHKHVREGYIVTKDVHL